AAFESVRYGVAGTAAANGGRELDKMNRVRGGQVAPWWRDDLARAAAHVPEDPSVREVLSLVMTRNSNEPADWEEAQRHLVAAIEVRPGSPYNWANLAIVKYRLGDTAPGFEQVTGNAAKLGPYGAQVQPIGSAVGVASDA